MRATKWQVNALVAIVLLTIIQGIVLWAVHDELSGVLLAPCPNPLTLGMIFAPVVAIAWVARTWAGDKDANGNGNGKH